MTTTNHQGDTTAVLTPVTADSQGTTGDAPIGDRLAGAATDVRERVGRLDLNAKLAWAGAGVTLLAFLVLPYAGNRGPAAEIGGRLWWRPLLAIAAAALVHVLVRKTHDGDNRTAIAAVAFAAAAVTEAGLFGLVSSSTANLRAGFYLMLAGTVLVLVAAVRAAVRRA